MPVSPPAMPRKTWVDTTRGLCMLAIVLNHTDYYLVGEAVVPFDLFGTDALMTFFIVSGYLFFRERGSFSIKRKLSSEFRHLVIPYFIFTLLIAIPKTLLHGDALSWDILKSIVCGQASWFVAARALAGIMFAALITLSIYRRWLLPVGCILLAVLPFVVNGEWIHIWNADIALMSLVYLCIGYLFHTFESRIEKHAKLWYCAPILLLIIVLKVIEQKYGIAVPVSPSRMSSFPVFFIDTCASAFVIITLCRRFNQCPFLNYVGRNSIVFYFLCGGVPLLMGMALRSIGLTYSGNYLLVLFDFALVLLVMSGITYIIIHYLPWMIGKTRSDIKRENNIPVCPKAT